MKLTFLLVAAALLLGQALSAAEPPPSSDHTRAAGQHLGRFVGREVSGRSVIVHTSSDASVRITPYGDYMIRVQVARPGEAFLPDDRLPMIERHDFPGHLAVSDSGDRLTLRTAAADGPVLSLAKADLHADWQCGSRTVLTEAAGPGWDADAVTLAFKPDPAEHFAGLGHGFYGRDSAPLDLHGRTITREYGAQASLVVPWFISSKGYGLFVNCAFPVRFRFDVDAAFDVRIARTDLGAQLDYVVVAGRTPLELIDRYTELTGRPRLQRKAMFGLQVSDKHRETESLAQGVSWWFDNLPKLRAAGIPVDGIIMDNTWRAGGGTWSDSIFAFDPKRYPDPRAFRAWADKLGLIVDVDFNGPMYRQSEGWKPEYGIAGGKWKKDLFYLPNFFRPDVDDWLWSTLWRNALDPRLGYPNDMLWMDETDQAAPADPRAPAFAGRPWLEMKNLYVLAGAKALVERWDRDFSGTKRPYIWFRSATSGFQRYCVYWSGDTEGNEADQSAQITAMLAAGVSGMPYFNHDAGGWQSITEPIYRRYGIVAGSLSPVWRVHGIKGPRWPTDYGADVLALARRYATLRYRLFPYVYSLARQASVDGTPMMRALFVDFPGESEAWKRDYQYLFGPSLLVAPPVASRRDVWLPPGTWTNWWSGEAESGGRTVPAPEGDDAAIYARAGAVIPMGDFALSSAFIPRDHLEVHIWAGADGTFALYEDDGTTERYRMGEYALTPLRWNDAARRLEIAAREGRWPDAPERRRWTIVVHSLTGPATVTANGVAVPTPTWDAKARTLSVELPDVAAAGVTVGLHDTGVARSEAK